MNSPQNLHIRDTFLGTGFELISLFTGATESQRMLMTLWGAHTWTYRTFPASPRLDFSADGPGTGKTVNMELSIALSADPVEIGYASQSSVYAYLEAHPDSTVGLDEIDKVFGADGRKTSRAILASVINSGYTSKGQVMVSRGGKAVLMPTYCPIAMAGIGTLPHDTLDRCVVIKLEKSQPDMTYIPELNDDDIHFVAANVGEILKTGESQRFLASQPTVADVSGSPRFRLITAPLAAIAHLAGCGDMFKTAISEIQTGLVENPPTPKHVLMIRDLSDVWPADAKIMSGIDLITMLRGHKSHRWDSISPSRVGEILLGGMFREAGIASTVRNGDRGYLRTDVLGESDITEDA